MQEGARGLARSFNVCYAFGKSRKDFFRMSTNQTPISIVRTLREQDLFYFTPHLLGALFGLERERVYRLVAQLKRDQLIAEVEKGKYLLLGLEPARVLANPLFIASQLITPSYVSYWSALHFYGFTEQAPLTIFVATTKKKRPVEFQGMRFRFVTIQPHKFFGYTRESVGELPVLIADPAKSVIDSLDQPHYSGGVTEIAKALRSALPEVEISLLEEYANSMGDRSLGSRLGLLLEQLGHPVGNLIRSSTPIKLDPSRSKGGNYSTRWHVAVNVPFAELFPAGVG